MNQQYLDEIKPFLKDIINNLQRSDTYKIQITRATRVMFSNYTDEKLVNNLKSDKQ